MKKNMYTNKKPVYSSVSARSWTTIFVCLFELWKINLNRGEEEKIISFKMGKWYWPANSKGEKRQFFRTF